MHPLPTTNDALLERRNRAVPRGVASAASVFADRASNSEIWDVEGRHFVDFAAGIAVLNTGHCHPAVIRAVETQLARFAHTAFQVVPYEAYTSLCERLNELAPITGPNKTVLFSTGAEAVENAVKIARAATRRSGIIAFTGAFHGRTLFASALTGKVAPYKERFGPMAAEVFHLPFPATEHGVSVKDSFRALDFLLRATIGPKQIAAIIVEPVQGEGGFYIAPPELLLGLRSLCDRHGIILIVDEIQTGFGRTGSWFAIEQYGVEPDLMTVAKSLAGGLPLSGVIGRAEIMDAVEPGGLGGTYAGNPLACAAALAVLQVIESESLLARAVTIGRRIKDRISGFVGRSDMPIIASVRGLGAMVAFELADGDGEPDPVAAKRVTACALDAGVVVLSCGVFGNVIRILAPLTIEDAVLEAGLQRLEAGLVQAKT